MELSDLRPIVDFYHSKLSQVSLDFKRYLYDRINWDARIIGIKGERGVGKTTMLIQRIKEKYTNPDETFYVSLDHFWFKTHSFPDLVGYLYAHGITELYVDEVHKYEDWSSVLKVLYDQYADLRIVYTGSSMLLMDNSKVDMSRRQTLYTLKSMSFREYLEYEGALRHEPILLEDLLRDHVSIAMGIVSRMKVLKEFGDYLKHGAYPFYKDSGEDFLGRLQNVVSLVLENDLPSVEKISYPTIDKCQKLFMIIADNVPLEPSIEKLAVSLSTTRDTLLNLLYKLDSAEILELLTVQLKSYKKLQKPAKVYLGNTNLVYAFSSSVNTGSLRETFFLDQAGAVASVQLPEKGDFLLDGKYLFEVGGAGKTFSQISGVKDSYLAIDDVETGYGAAIPLWMFGFLY